LNEVLQNKFGKRAQEPDRKIVFFEPQLAYSAFSFIDRTRVNDEQDVKSVLVMHSGSLDEEYLQRRTQETGMLKF